MAGCPAALAERRPPSFLHLPFSFQEFHHGRHRFHSVRLRGRGTPVVIVFNGIAELYDSVGSPLGTSSWHTITQKLIDAFAAATGDHQWVHVDPVRAANGPFGSTIAHGHLLTSMIPMLVWEVYDVDGVRMGINYGSNKIRYPTPVPVDSRIRAVVEIAGRTQDCGGRPDSHVCQDRARGCRQAGLRCRGCQLVRPQPVTLIEPVPIGTIPG
ncbi:MaoC family dehydratase [Antrihabitans stalactiti]|uniref:MaoC family dehydratase n=1 Tax=Antrihabitans stalactiti TaxID=2584121 RepID=UPI0030B80821